MFEWELVTEQVSTGHVMELDTWTTTRVLTDSELKAVACRHADGDKLAKIYVSVPSMGIEHELEFVTGGHSALRTGGQPPFNFDRI